MCFGKAIIKALYHTNGPLYHENSKSIANGNHILMTLAKELYAKAGVPEGRVSSEQYQKFQVVLANDDVRLIIYSMRYANGYIFKDPETFSQNIY